MKIPEAFGSDLFFRDDQLVLALQEGDQLHKPERIKQTFFKQRRIFRDIGGEMRGVNENEFLDRVRHNGSLLKLLNEFS